MVRSAIIGFILFISFFNRNADFNTDAKRNADSITQTSTSNSNKWKFDKVKGSKILFKDGNVFETDLYELSYIGQIKTDNKAPFLIYSGRDCDSCDANIALYFHSPRNGKLDVEEGKNRYDYPGKEFYFENNSLLYEATAYYGEVLKGVKGIIWYQNMLMENGKFQKNIFLLKIEGDKIKSKEILDYNKKLTETKALNKFGKNKEIKGMEYTSEP